jgi:hypothetical protein
VQLRQLPEIPVSTVFLISIDLAFMPPYSEAAQTAVVLNYDDIPNCLVGPEALLPPLDISVN